jgi:hypothetical protein
MYVPWITYTEAEITIQLEIVVSQCETESILSVARTYAKIEIQPVAKEICRLKRAGARTLAQTYCPPAEGIAELNSASVAAINMFMTPVNMRP